MPAGVLQHLGSAIPAAPAARSAASPIADGGRQLAGALRAGRRGPGRAPTRRASSPCRRSPGRRRRPRRRPGRPPLSPTIRTLNQPLARCSGVGPSPGVLELEQQLAGRRQLRQRDQAAGADGEAGDVRQLAEHEVVAVGEVRPVASSAAAERSTVCGSMVGNGTPSPRGAVAVRSARTRRGPCGPSGRPSRWRRCAGDADALAQPAHDLDRRVVGPAGERPAGADEALELERHVLGELADREQGAHVVGDRVEAAGVHEPGAGALGLLVVVAATSGRRTRARR